ncbi:MAG: DUF3817 domain-containing protein [Cyclobacteriaceae bacterium]|jgi:integral membrane protein|nr:DUF3817 domain-containing protein [Cyclobacteriaceae bacterium]
MKSIRNLRIVGITEGISFLVLLLIAMPLKYYFNYPLAVKWVGSAHGALFILYLLAVVLAIRAMDWGVSGVLLALLASLVPGGTFILDRSLRKREVYLISKAES